MNLTIDRSVGSGCDVIRRVDDPLVPWVFGVFTTPGSWINDAETGSRQIFDKASASLALNVEETWMGTQDRGQISLFADSVASIVDHCELLLSAS